MIQVGTNAYITESDYLDYANLRGIEVKSATLEADVVLSADFINTYYQLKAGYALPTTDLVSIAAIKDSALKACEMQQVGLLTVDLAAIKGGIIESESSSVGSLSSTVKYQAGSTPTGKARTPALDMLLRKSGAIQFSSGLVRV
jgi:hypothetical protein